MADQRISSLCTVDGQQRASTAWHMFAKLTRRPARSAMKSEYNRRGRRRSRRR